MQKQFILTKQFTEGLKKVQTTDKNKTKRVVNEDI